MGTAEVTAEQPEQPPTEQEPPPELMSTAVTATQEEEGLPVLFRRLSRSVSGFFTVGDQPDVPAEATPPAAVGELRATLAKRNSAPNAESDRSTPGRVSFAGFRGPTKDDIGTADVAAAQPEQPPKDLLKVVDEEGGGGVIAQEPPPKQMDRPTPLAETSPQFRASGFTRGALATASPSQRRRRNRGSPSRSGG